MPRAGISKHFKISKKNDIVVVESTVYPGASKELAKKFLKKKLN